jgi:hypothetical protein
MTEDITVGEYQTTSSNAGFGYRMFDTGDFSGYADGTGYVNTWSDSFSTGSGVYTGSNGIDGRGGPWVKLKMTPSKVVNAFNVYQGESSESGSRWTVIGSNDDITYTTLYASAGDETFNTALPKDAGVTNVSPVKAWKFIAFVVTHHNSTSSYFNLAEIVFT